jgi:hypothetical protein
MDLLKGDRKRYVIGAVAGFTASALVRDWRLGFADLGRPLAKATIKSGILLFERGRELFARMSEVIEDLAIEARFALDDRNGTNHQSEGPERDRRPAPATSESEVH